jgi:YD repeat-containing protein
MVGYSQPSSRNQVTRFEYSENGRKTRVATSTLQPSSDGPYGKDSMLLSLEFGEDLYYPTPLGGAVKTLYDENDRPTELQVYVAGGRLIERLVRTYDSAGRPVETKAVVEDISAMFPADFAKELLNQPGAEEELQRQLSELLGPQREFGKITYTYDSEGRVTEKHNNFGPTEIVTKFIYNNQGDKIEERTTTSGNPLDAANASAASHAMGICLQIRWLRQLDPAGPGVQVTS